MTELAPWRQIKRQDVQAVSCPDCAAAAGDPCQGRRGPRRSNHLARVELALDRRRELPRTGASTRSIEEQSRGAVSLDGDETSATIGAALVSTPLDR